MKRTLLYIGIAVVMIAVVIILIVQSLSKSDMHPISFNITQADITVTVYQKINQATGESKEIDTFSSTETINLPKGKYYYFVEGEHVDASTVEFSIPDETNLIVNPDYDSRYLSSLLETEVTNINQLIETNYAKITNGYEINPGKFYKQGQWYATIISDLRSTNEDPYDTYRIVLNKQNGNWVVMTTPEISLSAVTFSEIPREILSDINRSTIESLVEWSHTNSFHTD